ncbi:MAG: hypothetical protein ABJA87_09465 [bacterium]
MDVELLIVPDCPNENVTAQLLHTALVDVGLAPAHFRTTVISTPAEAEQRGFTGSPTVLLNGVDPFAEPGRPVGLSCRVYRNPSGSGGVPDLAALRQALKRAAARQ